MVPDAHDLDAVFGLDLEDREHQVLLAHGRRAFDAHLLGHRDELGGGFLFQVFQMHGTVFSWGVGARASRCRSALRRGRTPLWDGNGRRRLGKLAGSRLRFEVWSRVRRCQSAARALSSANRSERTDDDQHDDQRRGDSGNLVDHPQRLARQRPLAVAPASCRRRRASPDRPVRAMTSASLAWNQPWLNASRLKASIRPRTQTSSIAGSG